MAKKRSIVERLEKAASDLANATSVALTGSEIGVLERAAETDIQEVTLEDAKARAEARLETISAAPRRRRRGTKTTKAGTKTRPAKSKAKTAGRPKTATAKSTKSAKSTKPRKSARPAAPGKKHPVAASRPRRSKRPAKAGAATRRASSVRRPRR